MRVGECEPHACSAQLLIQLHTLSPDLISITSIFTGEVGLEDSKRMSREAGKPVGAAMVMHTGKIRVSYHFSLLQTSQRVGGYHYTNLKFISFLSDIWVIQANSDSPTRSHKVNGPLWLLSYSSGVRWVGRGRSGEEDRGEYREDLGVWDGKCGLNKEMTRNATEDASCNWTEIVAFVSKLDFLRELYIRRLEGLLCLSLTPSGTTNRKLLREIGAPFPLYKVTLEDDIVASTQNRPLIETEQVLQALWTRILKLIGKRIRVFKTAFSNLEVTLSQQWSL